MKRSIILIFCCALTALPASAQQITGQGLVLQGLYGKTTIASADAAALSVGPNGATNPVFLVVTNTASQQTGLSITGEVTGQGVSVRAIGSGTNEPLSLSSRGGSPVYLKNGGTVVATFGGDLTLTGRLIVGNVVRLKGYTVATLPAGTVGDTAYVTDATAPIYNTALTGGGSVTIMAFYNGTSWVAG